MITFEESIPTACPYCGMLYNTHLKGEPDSKEELGIEKCHACNMPYVVRQEVVLKVTTHRIDGLQLVEPQIKPEDGADILLTKPEETACVIDDFVNVQCEKCGVMFVGQWGTLYCQKCQEKQLGENDCTAGNPNRLKELCLPTVEEVEQDIKEHTCFKCGQKFNSENPCKWKGEIHCDDYEEADIEQQKILDTMFESETTNQRKS